jgi:hypothetical protein
MRNMVVEIVLCDRTRQAMYYNVPLRRVRVTVVAVAKRYYIYWVCVCSLSYPAYNAHAPYYIVTYGLSGSIFFHIISSTAPFSKKK